MFCIKSDRNYFRGGFYEILLFRDLFEGIAEFFIKNFFGSVEFLFL